MIVKQCRQGHDLTVDMVMKDGRCRVCYQAKRARMSASGYFSNYARNRRKQMTAEEKDKERERLRTASRKRVVKGERDYANEKAKALGITRDEYLAQRQAREAEALSKKVERQQRDEGRRALLASIQDAHVKQYRASSEYKRRLVKANYWRHREKKLAKKKRSVDNLLPGYVAHCMGSTVADIPAPLITCYRMVIRARRISREIQQR